MTAKATSAKKPKWLVRAAGAALVALLLVAVLYGWLWSQRGAARSAYAQFLECVAKGDDACLKERIGPELLSEVDKIPVSTWNEDGHGLQDSLVHIDPMEILRNGFSVPSAQMSATSSVHCQLFPPSMIVELAREERISEEVRMQFKNGRWVVASLPSLHFSWDWDF